MAQDNNKNNKRKVTRQNWKPGAVLTILQGIWKFAYSGLKVALGALATVLLIGGVCAVVFVGVLADYLEGDILPQAGVQLEGFDLNQPTYIYYLDDAGNIQVLQKLYADTDTEWATYEEIPKAMVYAAVSIEDHRFFEHQGVDWFTTIKACISMFVGGNDFGGSSITQQLIKNMLLTKDENADDVTVQRKVLEIFRATEFEKRYDKSVVLEWYLNYIFLGNRAQGVKAAAERYFGKEVEDLSAAECACIISITNNPTIFNPLGTKEITYKGETRIQSEWNKIRRNDTLWTMRNYGYLTEEEYQQALLDSENLVFKNGIDFEDRYSDCENEDCGYHGHNSTYVLEEGKYYCPQCGVVTTIDADASQYVYSWFVDTVVTDLAKDMATRDGMAINDDTLDLYRNLISRGGYHIYSTLNMEAQTAVDVIYGNLEEIPTTDSMQQLQSGICIIDNDTGDIIAIAGGVGEKTTFYAYNRATVNLQPGSAIKPLTIYSPAFELGLITPATVMPDMPLYYTGYEQFDDLEEGEEPNLSLLKPFPKNDSKDYAYRYNILKGVTSSINGVAVNTLETMGLQYSFNFAKDRFRLTSLTDRFVSDSGYVYSDIAYSPLALGAPTHGVSVRAMAAAYATFANNGVYREARTYTVVYNSDGEEVIYNEQESEKILSEKTVNYMNYCLTNAVKSGTGTAAKITGQTVAGKTGTTSSKRDRYFCGFTSYYTAAVWCGYDQPEVMNLTGSVKTNPACRLFKKVMTPLHEGLSNVQMYDDSQWVKIGICLDSGKLATDGCAQDRGGRVSYAFVDPLDIPTEKCDQHIQVEYCTACQAPASEYCKLFAQEGLTTISTTWLVKMTQKQVDDVVLACKHGLPKSYMTGTYVYLVDEQGNPANFYGMNGDQNIGIESPYLLCTTHTQATWLEYLASKNPTTEPTEPEDFWPGFE